MIGRVGMVFLAAAIASGCARTTTPRPAEPDLALQPDRIQPGEWPFRPASMRVHPLTRLVEETDGSLFVELRIEFSDAWGHATKAVGRLILDLYATPATGSSFEVLARWQPDLADLELNERHFDDLTTTYLFKLGVDRETLRPPVEVVAFFTDMHDRELEASYRVRVE